MTEESNEIPISAISQFVYCRRRFVLIHLEGEFEDNIYTLQGREVHDRVDESEESNERDGVQVERALHLWSKEFNLYGRADIVEFRPDGTIYPIEYKRGKKRNQKPDDQQLCAQALCLEEMFEREVTHGAIYYSRSKKRREVEFTSSLRGDTIETIRSIKQCIETNSLPPPLQDKHCENCSIKNICQPYAIVSAGKFKMDGLFQLDKED